MKRYDRGARFRAALLKCVKRERKTLEQTPLGHKRIERQYAYNYLARTVSSLDMNFSSFRQDEFAYQRGMNALSNDVSRVLRSPATPKGTRRAAGEIQALIRQFS